MQTSIKKSYTGSCLNLIHAPACIFMYICKCILCLNKITEFPVLNAWVSFLHGYEYNEEMTRGMCGKFVRSYFIAGFNDEIYSE